MSDKEFLLFIHDRLVKVYEEEPNLDFMWRLREIIYNTPEGVTSKHIYVSREDLGN